jgi:hypothetical protein
MILTSQILTIVSITGALLALISLALIIWLFVSIGNTKKNIRTLFSGKEAQDLESIILAHSKEIVAMDKEIQDLFEISNKIHALAQRSIHKVGVVRFNPFKDIGGDQSFALALLDGKNSGLVISSLHTREGTRIYSKPVVKGESEKYTLTGEEKEAIKTAVAVQPTKL